MTHMRIGMTTKTKGALLWGILLFLLLLPQAKAQRAMTLGELSSLLEESTPCSILYDETQLDSIPVVWNGQTNPPLSVLQAALEGTGCQIIEFQDRIIISRNPALSADLPKGFFLKEGESYSDGTILGEIDQDIAWSENKLYTVGASQDAKEGYGLLSGTVINYKNQEPLSGVTLFVEDPWIGTTTDRDGHFSIRLPLGRNNLQLKSVGMTDTYRQILLNGDGNLDMAMSEASINLEEVAIIASRAQNIRGTSMGMTRMKMTDIKNIPSSIGGADLMKAVMALPGVKSVGEVSSGFNVRGGSTDQNLILFDGGTVYNPSHMFGLFSIFNSDLVDGMELYKSTIPAKYGGRISSILDITSKNGDSEKINGAASIGLLTSGLSLNGPLGSSTTFAVGGRLTYSDWLLSKLPKKSGYSDGKAGFYDMNLGLQHRFNDHNSIKLTSYLSRDRFQFDQGEKYSYVNASVSLNYMHAYDDNHTGHFSGGMDHYGTQVKDISEMESVGASSFESSASTSVNPLTYYNLSTAINQYYLKADFQRLWNYDHNLQYGASALLMDVAPGKKTPTGESSVTSDELDHERALDMALYLSDNWDINDKLSVEGGLRWNIFLALGPRSIHEYSAGEMPGLDNLVDIRKQKGILKAYMGPEVRLSARYELRSDMSVKIGLSTQRQNIHKISNTTIMSPTDTWKLSDKYIKPQTGAQVSLGLYKNFESLGLETSVEGYYKLMNNFLDYKNGAILAMNHHLETDVLPSKGRSYGVEVLLKRNQGNLNGWISYTWSHSQLRQTDERIQDPVNGGAWYDTDYDRTHEVKVVTNYRFSRRFSVSLNCEYATGRPISLPVSKYQYQGGEYVSFSKRNEYRLPDNFRMDFSINIEPSHHLTNLTHRSLQIGVYNLTGRKNVYSVYYTSVNGELKGYKLAIFGVPIPYISYNIKF